MKGPVSSETTEHSPQIATCFHIHFTSLCINMQSHIIKEYQKCLNGGVGDH